MKNPLVSVVCTNYNKGEWISQAIESFLRQKTNFEFEIIVIDDCSTDNSPDIIRKFAEENDNIKAFFNSKNMGITKTWIKICKKAKGKYIARCDGDDYWIDELKLQKQVDLLEKSKNSKWCNTDFSTIDENGEILSEKSFESGHIKMSKNFTEMLVSKGFTNASTWLVDAELMHEINDVIDTETSDDTFNIQLELFARTELTFLPENTSVYRVNQGSDSHPKDMSKVIVRNKKLLDTQIYYLDKYKSKVDMNEALQTMLEINSEMENALIGSNKISSDKQSIIDDYNKTLGILTVIPKAYRRIKRYKERER